MNAPKQSQLLRSLLGRREAIADHWYSVLAPTRFVPFSEADVRARLVALVERVIAVLLAEPFRPYEAETIGVALAELRYLDPETLAQTQQALAEQLIQGLSAEQIAAIQPRLVAVLSEVAAGFVGQAQFFLRKAQEDTRAALLAERDEIVAALRIGDERLRALLTSAPVILFATDRAGTITFVEGSSLEALEIPPREMIGQSVFDIARRLPRADAPRISGHFHRALAGEAFGTIGTMAGVIFETRYGPLRNAQGEITGVIGVAVDITERRRVEQERDAARQQLAEHEKPKLTEKQVSVLQGIVDGKTDEEIGEELGISTRTVRAHLLAAREKLGATNRSQAVLRAVELGLIKL
jgi:PAS domain S-box-containing protein